jgi:hypothetical protein
MLGLKKLIGPLYAMIGPYAVIIVTANQNNPVISSYLSLVSEGRGDNELNPA